MKLSINILTVTQLLCVAVFLCSPWQSFADDKPDKEDPVAFFQAHRGAMDEMPENTMAAFRHAWSIPGAVPEVDIRTTSDGRLVCIHDDTPKRTTNAPPQWENSSINDIPFSELKKWDAGGHFGQAYIGEKVPLLDELFAFMKEDEDRQLYLDLKDVDVEMLHLKIKEHDLEQRVIFVHGDIEMCKQLKALYPGARTMTWISGFPDQQKEKFKLLAKTDFEGLSQLQFHLRHSRRKPVIQYALDEDYLKEAVSQCRSAGVELQLRPFLFTHASLDKLVNVIGVKWFVADAPHAFYKALQGEE